MLPQIYPLFPIRPGADPSALEFHHQTCDTVLDPGDRLLLYTDGIYEIFAGEKEFGLKGFRRLNSATTRKGHPLEDSRRLQDALACGIAECSELNFD